MGTQSVIGIWIFQRIRTPSEVLEMRIHSEFNFTPPPQPVYSASLNLVPQSRRKTNF